MDKTISNPLATEQTVTDFTTGKDSSGFALDFYNETVPAVANGTIAVGDLLTWVVPTATQAPRVNKVASGGSGTFLGAFLIAGICTKAAVAGGQTSFVKYGFALANIGAGVSAAGDMAVLGATAGQCGVIAAATGITAGTFSGNVVGWFLGVKDASNLAGVWVDRM